MPLPPPPSPSPERQQAYTSSEEDIEMRDYAASNNNGGNKDNLPEGAERESSSPKRERELTTPKIPNISTSYQLTLGTDKIRQIEGKITDEDLAGTLGTKKEEITIDLINGKEVMIISYENEEQLEEATTRNPILKTLQCKKPNVNTSSTQNDWIKIRQWPTNGDIEQIIILNDMVGWYGKVFPPKNNQRHTTAVLKAPSELEAKKLLNKGYIVNNGKLLAVVPQNSTMEEEERRTVLLVGIHRIQNKMNQEGSKLTEIGLLKSLVGKGYPIQSLKFVYHDEHRIGHSAYVLLKRSTPAQDLQPFQDALSNTIIKWAEVAEYNQICEKCLNWPGHLQTCNRHADNISRNINSAQIAKRAAEGGSVLLQRLKKQQPPSQEPPH
jgi:hypothetical protein